MRPQRSIPNTWLLALLCGASAACGPGAVPDRDAGADDANTTPPDDAATARDAGRDDANTTPPDDAAPTASDDAATPPDAGAATLAPLATARVPTRSVRAARMATARDGHTATLLPDGRVLVIGGERLRASRDMLASVEIYDPAQDAWTLAAPLPEPRANHTATLLDDGRVLVAGGGRSNAIGVPSGLDVRPDALLYDPITGTSTSAGRMRTPRHGHHAVRLPSGRVLLVGGADDHSDIKPAQGAGNPQPFGQALTRAELFDPATGTFTETGSMSQSRYAFTAVLLADGRVMVGGGAHYEGEGESLATNEIYDEATGRFSITADFVGADRLFHAATRLADGRVLIYGGKRANVAFLSDTQLWSPETGLFQRGTAVPPARTVAQLVPLDDGGAILFGGYGCTASGCDTIDSVVLWRADGTTAPGPPMNQARALSTATVLSDGRVLVVGGYAFDSMSDVEILTP